MKKLLAVLLTVFIIIPVGFAYAETTPQDNKAQLNEYKQKAKEKMTEIKQSKDANKALREKAKQKSNQMKEKIKSLRKNRQAIPIENLDKMEVQLQTIKEDMTKIKGWGSYLIEYERMRTNRLNKNYDGALQELDKIVQMQKDRNDALTKLNSDLDALVILIQ